MDNNNGIPNTPLTKRNMTLPPPNSAFNPMNNNMNNNVNENNQDVDLPSMEEIQDNRGNTQNPENYFNNNNFNNNMNNNINYNNNFDNQNRNENNEDNSSGVPPLPSNNEYPQYPPNPY